MAEWQAYVSEPNRTDAIRDLAVATCTDPAALRALEADYPALLSGANTVETLETAAGARVVRATGDAPTWAQEARQSVPRRSRVVDVVLPDGSSVCVVFRAPNATEYRMFRDRAASATDAGVVLAKQCCVASVPPLDTALGRWPGLLESEPFTSALAELLGVQSEPRKKK